MLCKNVEYYSERTVLISGSDNFRSSLSINFAREDKLSRDMCHSFKDRRYCRSEDRTKSWFNKVKMDGAKKILRSRPLLTGQFVRMLNIS